MGFSHPWLPNSTPKILKEMLEAIGVESPEELFSDIPEELRLKKPLNVGAGHPLSEAEVAEDLEEKASKTLSCKDLLCFAGGLAYHYVPVAIRAIISRSEFYTSYTPYQPEISQGVLQALFEYQSLMAELLEMDVVNASMYDGSTALAEAFLMAVRVTRRSKVLVPGTMNPDYLRVVETITRPHGVKVERIGFNRRTGLMDLDDLKAKVGGAAAVYVEVPSFLGPIEEQLDEISDITHASNALLVVGVDPISLGVLRPPGDYGADIVVGEGQPLGLGLNYGGPLLGIFAVRGDMKLIRQMPGRLIGMTTTLDGSQRGFTMILQTREQHIRREKATSNICTNEALCAITAAVYLSLLGPHGLRRLGEEIITRSHYAASKINELDGYEAPALKSSFFKQFVVRALKTEASKVRDSLLRRGVLVGPVVTRDFSWLGESFALCVTEVHSRKDIDFLVESLEEVVK